MIDKPFAHVICERLGSNESQPLVNPALQALLGPEATDLARLYPDPYATVLRKLAANLNQVSPDQVLFDSGADSLIFLALRLFCNVGDSVVTSAGSYPTFRYFAEGCGTRVLEVSLSESSDNGLEVDLGGLACSSQLIKYLIL